ncbi:hypothetical protein [Solicola sp. PLA-1-18]|uniref:hypothetical protein n=1 Tax=Solicola sp. PLA-1-18 TaxID=3380532 RepID=UPI003B7CA19E
MPDLDLVTTFLTDAMWAVIAASALGVGLCLARMRRADRHLVATPSDEPHDHTDPVDHPASKEN